MKESMLIHTDIVHRFGRLMTAGRLAHAYLLSGPPQIGKSETALEIARMMLCETVSSGQATVACQHCDSCLKMKSFNHPDLLWIDRQGDAETIKIEQIRDLITRLQMRAFYGGKKVCVIKNIEHLTAESSNALLKTLEEPYKDSFIFLTTSQPEENLGTVVSRCQQIKFHPLSVTRVTKQLLETSQLDPGLAQSLAHFSQGCVSQAQMLLESNFLTWKNDVINQIVMRENQDAFLKKVLADKVVVQKTLLVLLTWFRDLMVLKSGGTQTQLVHPDRYDELLRLEKKYSYDGITGIIEQIVETMKLLGENLNIKIPMILLREKIWVR